jgi:hypothetical protein
LKADRKRNPLRRTLNVAQVGSQDAFHVRYKRQDKRDGFNQGGDGRSCNYAHTTASTKRSRFKMQVSEKKTDEPDEPAVLGTLLRTEKRKVEADGG